MCKKRYIKIKKQTTNLSVHVCIEASVNCESAHRTYTQKKTIKFIFIKKKRKKKLVKCHRKSSPYDNSAHFGERPHTLYGTEQGNVNEEEFRTT